jgi:2-keto-4-pentenoate hydratase/2-oxohepta-3-ene-1,7-dioic acid hydratase in catechol pathway
VLNDVSARDCQFADKQFTRAKSFDTFAPCGPWILTADEVADPHRLRLWTLFNGELMQDASTRLMIHKIPKTIAYLSQAMTLKPGDILSTGTPAGVGVFRQEQTLLRPGAAIECGVEGVGVIRNRVERA